MSFGYLVMTSYPCPSLTKTRGETFSLIMELPDRYIYFRFCEGNFYTERNGETEAVITDSGVEFLKRIYHENQGAFIFVDTLLQNREGEKDFTEKMLKQLRKTKAPVIQAKGNLKIDMRKPYLIEI